MARHRIRKKLIGEINVVPYIDVMLVLLIIFMITAPLLAQGVKVDLPSADAKPLDRKSQEPLVVSVTQTGEYSLNIGETPDKPLDEESIVNIVAAVMRLKPQTQVLIRGDRDARYGDIVYVMTLLQNAGVPGVGLMTDPSGAPRKRRNK
ncbi:MAG: protein TolR [Gammaproteobacteria bacterium]|nr:MAG: protein TolR [Gammaproteobacteria bacterium]